jgi:CheY-like chemotaxis protein
VLAEATAYDAIFLDVEMPGMDGFELCTRIHATTSNRITPVVFVTRHADFDARAKSSLTGARDLIGKPFLTFEVALKALTLVLNRRLQAQAHGLMGLGEEGASNNSQIDGPVPEAPPNPPCTLVHAS